MYTTSVQFDHAIFKSINSWPSSLESAMRFFSEGLNQTWMKVLLGIILIAMIVAGKDTRKAAICSLIAFPLSDGTTNLFKHMFPLPRPYDDPNIAGVVTRLAESHSPGTASAHSANMMATAICMLIALRWGGIPWLILAIFVGLSRIYNGAHYPYQVALGWIVGAFFAVLVSTLWQIIAKKRSPVEKSSEPTLNPKDGAVASGQEPSV
jgi:undecaprenyl-diphosphatase